MKLFKGFKEIKESKCLTALNNNKIAALWMGGGNLALLLVSVCLCIINMTNETLGSALETVFYITIVLDILSILFSALFIYSIAYINIYTSQEEEFKKRCKPYKNVFSDTDEALKRAFIADIVGDYQQCKFEKCRKYLERKIIDIDTLSYTKSGDLYLTYAGWPVYIKRNKVVKVD